MRCPSFKLGGIQGDLAEAGEVFIDVRDQSKLYLALAVDGLMLELQARPQFGGSSTANSEQGGGGGGGGGVVGGNSISTAGFEDSVDSLAGTAA